MEERDTLEERKNLVQDVIDRQIKYGEKYTKALQKFHEKFPTNVKEVRSESLDGAVIRSYK